MNEAWLLGCFEDLCEIIASFNNIEQRRMSMRSKR